MLYRWNITLAIWLSFLLVGADYLSDELPQPENVKLAQKRGFCSMTVEWTRPTNLEPECTVNYTVELYTKKCPPSSPVEKYEKYRTDDLKLELPISNDNDNCIVLTTNPMKCGNKKPSKPMYKDFNPSLALVKDMSCVYYSRDKMNCTWSSNTSDLRVFYRVKDSLKSCSSYMTNGHMKTGCHLHEKNLLDYAHPKLCFIIESGNSPPKIFNIIPTVKPQRPKVNITRDGNILYLQSSIPDLSNPNPDCLQYKFKYSKCNETEIITGPQSDSSLRLDYDSACKYTVQVQTLYSTFCWGDKDGESDLSETVYYGTNNDPNRPFKVAIIVTPLILSCCVIVALVLFRRHKDIILPRIPEPSLLFKDMLNSTSDVMLAKGVGGGKLYVPIKETVEKDIRLEPAPLS